MDYLEINNQFGILGLCYFGVKVIYGLKLCNLN